MVYPPAIMPRMFFSMMRVPRIVGLPPQIAGSTLTRSSICAPPSLGTALRLPSSTLLIKSFSNPFIVCPLTLPSPPMGERNVEG